MRDFKVFFTAILFVFTLTLNAEDKKDEKPWYEKGQLYGKVFANFHTSGSNIGKANAFEVKRAYFGYKYIIDDYFSTNVKLDIGSAEHFSGASDAGVVAGRRFAFFKNAYLQYKYQNLQIQFGIADAFQFKIQESFWGYRYIYKSLQDQNKFGSSADIGIFVTYKFTNWISADYSLNNGDGYGSLQIDDNLKNTLGMTLLPVDFLTLRGYWDIYSISDSNQMTAGFFAGIKFKPFSLGAEYVFQKNNKLIKGNDHSGISMFATYNLTDKFKVFGRYDLMTSVEIDDGANVATWSSRDGDFVIGGVEYAPNKNVKLSLNYQYHRFDKATTDVSSIYLSLLAKF